MTGELLDSIANWQQQTRPASLDSLLGALGPLLPVLNLIPNAAIFIKDAQARYLLANQTLVERCGLKSLQPLLGKTSAEVFPSQLGPGYTAQDIKVLKDGLVLESQLELHLFNSREPGWMPDLQMAAIQCGGRHHRADRHLAGFAGRQQDPPRLHPAGGGGRVHPQPLQPFHQHGRADRHCRRLPRPAGTLLQEGVSPDPAPDDSQGQAGTCPPPAAR